MEIKVIKENGDVEKHKEYSNSWGGAAYVWTKLYEKYLKDPKLYYDNWMTGDTQGLWDLYKDESIPLFERTVLASTLDDAVIRRENLEDVSKAFKEFLEAYPKGNMECHLQGWIDDIAEILKDETNRGICFHQTSVGEDPWYIEANEDEDEDYDEDVEGRPYNIDQDNKHWFVFKDAEEIEAEEDNG